MKWDYVFVLAPWQTHLSIYPLAASLKFWIYTFNIFVFFSFPFGVCVQWWCWCAAVLSLNNASEIFGLFFTVVDTKSGIIEVPFFCLVFRFHSFFYFPLVPIPHTPAYILYIVQSFLVRSFRLLNSAATDIPSATQKWAKQRVKLYSIIMRIGCITGDRRLAEVLRWHCTKRKQ